MSNRYSLIRIADIDPEPVEWLWHQRLPAGMVCLLEGHPGTGKSTVTAALAAAVSQGQRLPGDISDRDPGDVVILSLEDDPARIIRPRLEAAGADLDRVHLLKSVGDGHHDRLPRLPDDIDTIRSVVLERRAKLVVVDPFIAALSGSHDSFRDQDVRRVLAPLQQICEDSDVTVLLIRHLTKATGRLSIMRGGGSVGIIAAARTALLLTAHPSDSERLALFVHKSNLGVKPNAMTLRIQAADNGVGQICWETEEDLDPEESLAQIEDVSTPGVESRTQVIEAITFLNEELSGGPLPSQEILARSRTVGFSKRTLERAKAQARVASLKEGQTWYWSRPPDANTGAYGSSIEEGRQDRHTERSGEHGDVGELDSGESNGSRTNDGAPEPDCLDQIFEDTF